MRTTLILAFGLLFSLTAVAGVTVGEALPELKIEDRGELRLNDEGDAYYIPWSSNELDAENRVQIVQYVAGRPTVERRLRIFTDALEARNFPDEYHQVVSIVNLDDVTFGASGFAVNEMEKNKAVHPEAVMVADADGKGLERWGLERRNVAVMILDREGKVAFFKEGAMNEGEINEALGLIAEQIDELRQGTDVSSTSRRRAGPR